MVMMIYQNDIKTISNKLGYFDTILKKLGIPIMAYLGFFILGNQWKYITYT